MPPTKSHDSLLHSIHYVVERPYMKVIHGWSVIIEPYRICLSEYSLGASQASSLLNQPLLSGCHPLESAALFLHPIPFISTLLLILSLIISWVFLNIIILNGVWYICWQCVKEINPLRFLLRNMWNLQAVMVCYRSFVFQFCDCTASLLLSLLYRNEK